MSDEQSAQGLQRADFELLRALRERLNTVRLRDRARLTRELERLFARRSRGDFDKAVPALSQALNASATKVAELQSLPLKLSYDPDLPITAHREEILKTIATQQVLILCGATGSGKTTQLPKFCLEAGRGAFGLIGHTQPRRIAARAIASRLASELATPLGNAPGSGVGYQVRFNDQSGPHCRVKLMTDGILLKELEGDRNLWRYDTLIIDEAHERSLNIDLLLGVLKGVLQKRADLKLIVTSATIDPQKFSAFFGNAPIIEVSGRSYPVEVRYRPLLDQDEDAVELSLPEGVVAAVRELDSKSRGDVLVFLPGEKQIRECNDELVNAKFGNTEILPLFSRLSTNEQERIFANHSQRRVVLATNVAETSLTVPGIRNVIDSGLARISRYSVRGKVQRLPIEKIAKASADQRKGRCGREADGICIRLFDEEDFNTREDFTPPEILRTNLASVILRLAVLGLGTPDEFPFIDPPDTRLVNDGYRLLHELKAVDGNREVTSLGKKIASLPVDPRLACMLLAASHHACVSEMLILTSFLEVQDPRERPSDMQQQADQAHAVFADPRSDFVAVLNLWNAYQSHAAALSGNQLRKWCREHFLSVMRMREWQELHRQLAEPTKEIGLIVNQQAADYADLHQAILTGFLGHIGTLEEKREYLGARSSRFTIAPGTPLASKPPKWIVAGSIMETTRVFARMVAAIEPEWIERAGQHLLKRSYAEPLWVEQKGFVSAYESVSLYGLILVGQRRVNFGSVMPKEAREIFVREALVEGRTHYRAEFLQRNRNLRDQVMAMESKIRRRDILVDDQALCAFYLSRLPEHVHSIAALDKWIKKPAILAHSRSRGHIDSTQLLDSPTASFPRRRESSKEPVSLDSRLRGNDEPLQMSLADLMTRDAAEISSEQYPDYLTIDGNRLSLSYVFEPGKDDDGATLTVPEPLLVTLRDEQLAWAIPGWRLEKLTALLRALPKEQRKHFVPVPDAAARCLQELGASEINPTSLAHWIARASGQATTADQLMQLALPDHLRINLRITTIEGKVLRQGRDVISLRRAVRTQASVSVPSSDLPKSNEAYRSWDFGDLPQQRVVDRNGIKFTVYPAIAPHADPAQGVVQCVTIVEKGTIGEAEHISRQGLLCLAMLALPQQVKFARQQFTAKKELVLLSQAVANSKAGGRPLVESFAERVFLDCFISAAKTLPRTKGEFDSLLDAQRSQVGEVAIRLANTMLEVLEQARAAKQLIAKLNATTFAIALADIQSQLNQLVVENFLVITPDPWLNQLPRYLRALVRRLERLPGNVRRDAELCAQLQPSVQALAKLKPKDTLARPEYERLRWMIEEYRVSLFAQDLKTSIPVSDKRLVEQVQRAIEESKR